MYGYKLIMTFSVFLFLIGCANDLTGEPSRNQENSIELTKISSNNSIDQSASNQAKEILSNHEEITAINAVNTLETLVIAVDIEHSKRFRLADIRKELTKEMKEQFKDIKVEFSTDKKILLELEKLEEKIQSGSIKKKKLEKEIKRITKLVKEKT